MGTDMESVHVRWTCHLGGGLGLECHHSQKIVVVLAGVQDEGEAWEEADGDAGMLGGCVGCSQGEGLAYAYEAEVGNEPLALEGPDSSGALDVDSPGVASVEQGEGMHSPLVERERHLRFSLDVPVKILLKTE